MASSEEYQSWIQWIMRILAVVQTIIPGEWPVSYEINDGDRFDFIVVGAGSAGAIVASRLSEIADWTVLLIEAGGDPSLASVVPNLYPLLLNSEYDWGYKGRFDKGTGLAHADGMSPMFRGKCLGGSSSINFEIYARGKPKDYDDWAEIAPGWGWNSTIKYFKKSEGMTDPDILSDPNLSHLHSIGGPVLISRPKPNKFIEEKQNVLFDSLEEIGVKRIKELNGLETHGATLLHYTFANGRRSSTAEAFLKSDKTRPNLYIAKYTRATKVLIDSSTKQAYGVEVLKKCGKTAKIYVDGEVIVSAGAIDSPKLLMLSGIGPKDELKKHNIDVIANLPVGHNYKDHIVVNLVLMGQNITDSKNRNIHAQQEQKSTSSFGISAYFSVNNDTPTQPQFQLFSNYCSANYSAVEVACKTAAEFEGVPAWGASYDSFCRSVKDANIQHETETHLIVMLHPSSSGKVTLNSNNPLDNPVIDPGYFREEKDVKLLAQAVKFVARLANTSYYRKVNGKVAKLNVKGCEGIPFGSDKYWECFVRNSGTSLMHPVGTCAMGKKGVVDSKLKVHGITGLRIADASVIPITPSANTNAPTMMVGERAADQIKEDYYW